MYCLPNVLPVYQMYCLTCPSSLSCAGIRLKLYRTRVEAVPKLKPPEEPAPEPAAGGKKAAAAKPAAAKGGKKGEEVPQGGCGAGGRGQGSPVWTAVARERCASAPESVSACVKPAFAGPCPLGHGASAVQAPQI